MAGPMVFVAPTGAVVVVGRDAAQNHEITRAAGGADVWMHAEGPGAHVILTAPAGPGPGDWAAGGPDPRDLRFAADLAVYWTKARGARARVTVAGARDVRTRRDGSAAVPAGARSVVGRPLAAAPRQGRA